MEVIKLRAYFMNRYAYWLLASMVISTILIFIIFDNISREDRFMFSSFLMGAEAYLGFFLNRFEPEIIVLKDNEFDISYLNFNSFAKANATYNKNEVEVVNKGDKLLLSYENRIIGKVREKATSAENWTLLEKYFI